MGLSDKTDVLQSQASYDTARANRMLAQRQVEDAFESLVTLTNRQYNAIEGMRHTLPILPPMPNDAKSWVDTAAQQNLNLLASNYPVSAAEETLKQRKAGHAPTLDAVAQYKTGDNDEFTSQTRYFSGGRTRLLDAYVFGGWRFDNDTMLDVKAGRHIESWGESLYYPGVNGVQNPSDAVKAAQPGVEVKEVLLPVGITSTRTTRRWPSAWWT